MERYHTDWITRTAEEARRDGDGQGEAAISLFDRARAAKAMGRADLAEELHAEATRLTLGSLRCFNEAAALDAWFEDPEVSR